MAGFDLNIVLLTTYDDPKIHTFGILPSIFLRVRKRVRRSQMGFKTSLDQIF